MLRQKLTNGIFSPQPIFSISRRERVGGISIHPFGPLRSIKVDGRISPCGEFPNYSGFSCPGHAGNQYALHVCFLPMATHCWYRLLARGGRVLPAGLRPELFLGATDCQRERSRFVQGTVRPKLGALARHSVCAQAPSTAQPLISPR